MRERLPNVRRSVTHRVKIGTGENMVKVYITVGMFEDGRPGEVFLQLDEKGTALSGFCICVGILISLCLQNGVDFLNRNPKGCHSERKRRIPILTTSGSFGG